MNAAGPQGQCRGEERAHDAGRGTVKSSSYEVRVPCQLFGMLSPVLTLSPSYPPPTPSLPSSSPPSFPSRSAFPAALPFAQPDIQAVRDNLVEALIRSDAPIR